MRIFLPDQHCRFDLLHHREEIVLATFHWWLHIVHTVSKFEEIFSAERRATRFQTHFALPFAISYSFWRSVLTRPLESISQIRDSVEGITSLRHKIRNRPTRFLKWYAFLYQCLADQPYDTNSCATSTSKDLRGSHLPTPTE